VIFMWRRLGLVLESQRFLTSKFGGSRINNRVAEDLLQRKEEKLQQMRERLNSYAKHSLSKTDMYRELTELTEVMDPEMGDTIMAVSSLNISDWESAHAQVYLEANRKAVERGVPVMRLFMLERDNILGVHKKRYCDVVRRNHNALTPEKGADVNVVQTSGVKWILKEDVPRNFRNLDVAIFARTCLMRQQASQEYELIIEPEEIRKVIPIFSSLWNNRNVSSYDRLEETLRSGKIK
jgi:hypothetical protein